MVSLVVLPVKSMISCVASTLYISASYLKNLLEVVTPSRTMGDDNNITAARKRISVVIGAYLIEVKSILKIHRIGAGKDTLDYFYVT